MLKASIGRTQQDKYAGYIASKMLLVAQKTFGEAEVCQAEVATVLEEGWTGAATKPYEEKLKASTTSSEKFSQQLDQHADDADEMIAAEPPLD